MGTTNAANAVRPHNRTARLLITAVAMLSLIATQLATFAAQPADAQGGGGNFVFAGVIDLSDGDAIFLGDPTDPDTWTGPAGQNVVIPGYSWGGDQAFGGSQSGPAFHLSCSATLTGTNVTRASDGAVVQITSFTIYRSNVNNAGTDISGSLICTDRTFTDIDLTKTASTATTTPGGDPFTYTVTMRNTASGNRATAATGITLTDVVPDEFQITGVTATGPSGSASACTFSGQTVTCNVPRLRPGGADTFAVTIAVTPRASAACGPTTNVASTAGGSAAPRQATADVEVADCGGSIVLDKVDAEGNRLAGATLHLFNGSPGSLGAQVGSDCVTDGASACTFAPLPFGTYTAVEAAAPDGYRLAGSTPRELTLTTSSPDLTESWTFSNDRIPYRISVDPDAVNPVGDPHVFTVLVEEQDEQGAWQPLPAADVTLGYAAVDGFSEAGAIVAVEAGTVSSATSATCTTADGTGALDAGTCLVTVNSGSPAKGELTATFATPYQHATSPTAVSDTTVGATGVPGAIADSATKEWQGLHVDIAEDGVNLAGSPHPFTVTVTDSNGDPLAGASVTVEWDGPTGTAIGSTVVGDDGDPVEVTFTTGTDGTVTFSVTSDDVASGTATVTKVVALVDGQTLVVPSGGDPETGQLAIDFSDDDVRSASKDWIDYRVEISDDAVNYIEWAHTFTISVYELTPDGPTGGTLRPGATVTAEWETTAGANGIVAVDRVSADDDTLGSCETGAAGTCTITVEPTSGEVPSSGTLTVTSVGNVGVDADGVVDPSGTGGVAVPVHPVDATKEWVDYGVDVTPDGVNPIGTADPDDSRHTFTVTVSRSASSLDAGSDLSGIVVDLVWQGDVGSIVEVDGTALDPGVAATTCVTDAAGTCTVVVDSDEVGSGSLIVTGLTDAGVSDDANDAAEVTFLAEDDLDGFECPAEADGVARICATKTWVDFQLEVTPPFETNHIDLDHTFDVELLGLPDGASVDRFTYTFSGSLAGSIETVSDTCTGGDNPCAITVSSDVPGSLRLTVTSADITIPGEGSFTIPFGTGAAIDRPAAANQADKDYVDYLVAFEPPATNLLGDEHPFEVAISRITGFDGQGNPVTEPAADATVTLCWEGGFGSTLQGADDDACVTVTTDADGRVTVTVDSPAAPADGELTIASLTDDGDVRLPDDGVTSFRYVDDRDAAEKAWIAFRVTVSPDEATNLAADELNDGRSVHDFTVHVQVARAVADAPVGNPDDPATWTFVDYEGATIDVASQVTWTPDDSTYVSGTCATGTAADGTCTIRVDSATPGSVTIEVTAISVPGSEVDGDDDPVEVTPPALITAYEVAGDSFDATGTKTWVRYAVSVDADAVNLTGDAHTFYVQVTRDAGDGPAGANGVLASLDWSGAGEVSGATLPNPGDMSDLGSCLTGTLAERPAGIGLLPADDAGWCTVTVNSATPGEGTLTVAELTAPDITDEVQTDGGTTSAFTVAADDASKTWIDVEVEVTPPTATNVAGDDHDFDVTVYVDGGGAEVTDVEVCLSWDGVGIPAWDVSDDADCLTAVLADAPAADGRAVARLTVTVTAPDGPQALVDTAGMGTLSVDAVNLTVEAYGASWDFTVPEGDTGFGLASGFTFPVEGHKLWIDYGLRVTPPTAVNPLPGGEEHTFTVELRSSDPGTLDGELYTPGDAPIAGEGVTIALTYTGVGTVVSGADVDDDGLTCSPVPALSDDDEVIGVCTITVTTSSTDDTPSDGVGVGTLTATFTATADGEGELVLTDQGTKTWIAIQLVKEATGGVELDGDTKYVMVDPTADPADTEVLYTYWITNPGPDPLELTTLVDDRIGDISAAMIAAAEARYDGSTVMPVGDTLVVADVPYALTAADLAAGEVENVAIVTGRSTEDPDVEVTAEDDEVVEIREDLRPAISLVKTATDADVPFEVVDGVLVLSFDAATTSAEVTYTYVITNTGNEPLVDLTLVDDKIGVLDGSITVDRLDVGGSTTVTATYTTTPQDLADGGVTNVATTTGTGERSEQEVDDTDDETVRIVQSFQPAISLVKTATDADVPFVRDAETGQLILFFDRSAGIDSAEVTYTYVITNSGDEPLVDLTLFDDKIGVLDASITVDRLDVGESTTVTATYTTTPEDLEAIFVTNVATTTGTGENSGEQVDDVDDETVEILEVFDVLQPRIQVVKDAVAGVTVGDNGRLEVVLADTDTATVTYRYVVTNTGSDDLTDLTLVDDKIGDLTAQLTAAVVAAYGEPVLPVTGSVTFTADHVVRVSDFDDGVLTNVVVVQGTGVETGTSVTDDDDETVVLIQVFDTVITPRPTATSTPLPKTGLDAALLTALGVALTMLGLAALLGTDRRRRRQE